MSQKSLLNVKALLGCGCVFASAFCFYLATVVIKRARMGGLDIAPSFFVFARFFLGFVAVSVLMAVKKQPVKVKKKGYLIGRAVTNLVAVYCFFKGVDLTSVAQANILNMTYPLFIALFSWIFFKDQRDTVAVLIVMVAFVGVWLILSPGKMTFEPASLWGLASGISAALAIMYLNLSRQYHDTETTLFFLFAIGSVVIFAVFFKQMNIPKPAEFKYLLWCAFFSFAGQYLITIGFKYVTAIEGSIISSTRILLAALLGPFIAMDPAMSLAAWVGAVLIFTGNVCLTIRKARQ